MAQLPEGCRTAFVLHDVHGLEHREIGEIMGIAEGTSKSQVHKRSCVFGRCCRADLAVMNCTRSTDDIQALIDGTLGQIRAAELERHLDECDVCRALADVLRRIRDVADTLDDPPAARCACGCNHQGRLRQEGRVRDATGSGRGAPASGWSVAGRSPPRSCRRRRLLAPSDSAVHGFDDGARRNGAARQRGRRRCRPKWRRGLAEGRTALQSGVAKLKEGLGSDEQALPTGMAGTLDRDLQILDQAIAESSGPAAEGTADVAARNSLFDALQRKISLLQDMIS